MPWVFFPNRQFIYSRRQISYLPNVWLQFDSIAHIAVASRHQWSSENNSSNNGYSPSDAGRLTAEAMTAHKKEEQRWAERVNDLPFLSSNSSSFSYTDIWFFLERGNNCGTASNRGGNLQRKYVHFFWSRWQSFEKLNNIVHSEMQLKLQIEERLRAIEEEEEQRRQEYARQEKEALVWTVTYHNALSSIGEARYHENVIVSSYL